MIIIIIIYYNDDDGEDNDNLFIPLLTLYSTKASRRLSWTKPRGVLWISSDSDYPRIFLGLKFSISGIFFG